MSANAHPRFATPTRFNPSDVPIPTTRRPPQHAQTLRRNKTLTRPERGVAPQPLITPPAVLPGPGTAPKRATPASSNSSSINAWSIFCHIVTFWAPAFILSAVAGLKDAATRQAWREKIGLCFIAVTLGGTVGFLTMGLDRALCPDSSNTDPDRFSRIDGTPGLLGVQGLVYNVTNAKSTGAVNFQSLSSTLPDQDITYFFQTDAKTNYPLCLGMKFTAATDGPCLGTAGTCPIADPLTDGTLEELDFVHTDKIVGYDWDKVNLFTNYFVIDGAVLNLNSYMKAHPTPIANDLVDSAIRTMVNPKTQTSGRDGTRLFFNRPALQQAVPCLKQRYYAGNIDKITPGCAVSQLILYAGLIVILGLVLIRFAMACVFNWFISARLVLPPKNLGRKVISPAVMPEGANVQVNSKNGTAPWAGRRPGIIPNPSQKNGHNGASPVITMAQIGAELFTVCLVTCYSEGEQSIRATLDSISLTSYSDSRKMLFIICDGMVTGDGEKRSTPDICVGLLDLDPRFGEATPMSYKAVGIDAKAENRGMVYAGHYTIRGRRTPTIIVVKCGMDSEAHDRKPGNRGKRDSQLILMNFFSRVTYNDLMTPLDFDLFRKIQILMGVTPDFFEACLMVDADTKVYPDSLRHLVNSLHHDHFIMGVCGETRISNKRQSWVTAIQVYEYFISHHLAKAFESVFGGVTCLPGCFSMYRLKGRKVTDDDWVPLLVNPEIVQEYSQSEVKTLHQKNLLLLGEDRFLTTILLRKFPNRKMMFLPQARCRTVAPDTFSVLLSQRRRWINSTIHNLMELVRVRQLCGTFCFSMQFVVFMDLLGTATLPVAIALTYSLIVAMALQPPDSFEKAIPLILLASVIGLPAVLILITTRKVVYVFWMLIYLIALPIWNFIMPIYAFWHFDDFSWGETRKVAGERKGAGHDDGKRSAFTGTSVPLRRWEDWERSRLRKLKREEKRRRDMERAFPTGYNNSDQEFLAPRSFDTYSQSDMSDTISVTSSEEDLWGGQIGGYNEHSAAFPPPPIGLVSNPNLLASAETLRDDDMEAILEAGFDDSTPPSATTYTDPNPNPNRPRFNNHRPTPSRPQQQQYNHVPRYDVTDSRPAPRFNTYAPPPLMNNAYGPVPLRDHVASPVSPYQPTDANSSAVEWRSHAKKRSIGRGTGSPGGATPTYGPLGPLDPGS